MTWQITGLTGLLATDVLAGIWIQTLGERSGLPLNHPALVRVPASPGAEIVRVPHVGLGGIDLMSQVHATDETTASTLVAHTESNTDISLSRYAKHYDASDLAKLLDASGVVRDEMFAMDALATCNTTLASLLTLLVDNFATTAGTSGVDMSASDFLDAIGSLQVNNAEGPYLSILAPIQVSDLRKDLALNSGGSLQWDQGSAAMVNAQHRSGYQGSFAGVDIVMNDFVDTTGGNRRGGMFARGAIGYAIARPVADPDFPQIVLGDECLFEKDRSGTTAVTSYITNLNVGVSELIDLNGVSIITDA
jgi:hypothetical protein